MKRFFLFVLAFSLIFIGCKKTSTTGSPTPATPVLPTAPVIPVTPSNTENLLTDNTHIIDTIAVSNLSSNSITVNKSNTLVRPKIGDILITQPSLNTPFGLLVKVTNVTESTNQIICTTEQSNLNDAFKQLNIDVNYTDNFSTNANFRTGSPLTGSNFSVKFNANNTLVNGIGLDGELKFNIPSMRFEYKKKNGSLLPEKILIQADLNMTGSSLEIKNTTNSAVNIASEFNLITFNLPTITIPIPIGSFIIPIPFTQQINIKMLPISVSGRAKWTTNPEISATLGVKYENSTWTNLCTYTIGATAQPLSQLDFGAAVLAKVMFVKPVYEIRPLGQDLIKAFFEVPNYFELTIQTPAPNYSLKYKLDVTGGIKQKFWLGVEQEYSITGSLIEKTILEGNFVIQSPILLTSAVSSITQTSATSGGNITNDGGATITARGVCWSTTSNPTITNSKTSDGTGTGSFTSSITGLTANTMYHVRAYATNSARTAYGNEVTFLTSSAPVYTIGQTYGGGIIFYIDGTLQHGLITSTNDLTDAGGVNTNIDWSNGSNLLTSANGTAISTGLANTNTIIAAQGAGNYAAKICRNYAGGGFTDWYLPSKDELNQLYINRNAVNASGGGFTTYSYWSSTEANASQAWAQSFQSGTQTAVGKSGFGVPRVRAIRSF